jgi:hypothetical protein
MHYFSTQRKNKQLFYTHEIAAALSHLAMTAKKLFVFASEAKQSRY